jgi:hypothetical protein
MGEGWAKDLLVRVYGGCTESVRRVYGGCRELEGNQGGRAVSS